MKTNTSLILTVAILALSGSALAEVKIARVAKSLGNGFFEAANVGAQEAAKELGDVKVIYTGPTTSTAEAQIEVLNGLIAQGVDAIAISANDPDAVVPVLKKAMQRGIKVVSWDSGVAPAGRQIHLNPSNNALIGETNVKLAADALKALNVEKGDVAILSATPTSTNQNIWIEEMKKVLPQYPSVNLVTVAYGDDLSDKSYREAVGLLKSYPDLKVIVSPSSVGIVAAAQASDGDNWADDSPLCHELLAKKILPVVRYYSYIEITRRAHQTLWREYEHLQSTFENFAMQHIRDPEDIYPVFRELFHKQTSKADG
ncbi:DUF444 family protein [Klebsiella michiganensis]